MEGLRSLDVAHREGAVGPVEQRVPEILPDRVFPHLVEERDGREHEVAFLFAGQLDLDPLHVDAKGPFVFRVVLLLDVPLDQARLPDGPFPDDVDLQLEAADSQGARESARRLKSPPGQLSNVAIAARPVRPRPNRRESFKTPFRHRIPAMDSGGGKITLDQESFKALASDVRVGILKRLDVRRETVTDLSGLLNLSKPTLLEHLEKLQAAGLVKRIDEGRKWIYYALSDKGHKILHPERVATTLALAAAVVLAGIGVFYVLFASGALTPGAPLLNASAPSAPGSRSTSPPSTPAGSRFPGRPPGERSRPRSGRSTRSSGTCSSSLSEGSSWRGSSTGCSTDPSGRGVRRNRSRGGKSCPPSSPSASRSSSCCSGRGSSTPCSLPS